MLSEIKNNAEKQTAQKINITGLERVLHIEFDLGDKTLKAAVVSRILDMDQKLKRDRACVQLAAPVAYDDLPNMAKLRIYALATCAQALLDPPAWLNEWIGRFDPLLFQVYEGVVAHESAFFRLDMAEGTGTEEKPIVRVSATEVPVVDTF
jgi:hypothetical protein